MKNHEKVNLTDDGRVYFVPYVPDFSPEMPLMHKRPGIVVVPGGGYQMTSDREAEPIALAFAARGFDAFVLRYSVNVHATWPNPIVDLMRAMAYIRAHADEYMLIPNNLAVVGFSAGGHLTAALGVYWNDPELLAIAGVTSEEAKPNALILNYPVITGEEAFAHEDSIDVLLNGHENDNVKSLREKLSLEKYVGPHTPPCLIYHTFEDSVVPVKNSLAFATALAENNVRFEMRIIEEGPHGSALGTEMTAMPDGFFINRKYAAWPDEAMTWLNKHFNRTIN